jgi:hypothetical protein
MQLLDSVWPCARARDYPGRPFLLSLATTWTEERDDLQVLVLVLAGGRHAAAAAVGRRPHRVARGGWRSPSARGGRTVERELQQGSRLGVGKLGDMCGGQLGIN